MRVMKTTLMILALALMVSFTGSASTVSSQVKNQTENMVVAKTTSSSSVKSGKAKKAHHKNHKSGAASKKSK